MDAFIYLSVLISIVLGLGLTRLLTGFADMVRARRRTLFYWPLVAQMCLLFLVHVQLWWALFALRDLSHWNFFNFLVVLMQPVLLYLATAILMPDFATEEQPNLRSFYFRESQCYFGVIIASVVVSLTKNIALFGRLQNPIDLAGHLGFFSLGVAGFISQRDIVHRIVAPLSLLTYGAYIGLLFVSLPD